MTIIETPIFTRKLKFLLKDEEYRKLQNLLLSNPEAGSIISKSGGLRKLRWSGSSRGKRGGYRIIYYWFSKTETILMILIYSKKDQDDLSPDQLKTIKALIEREFK